jgi:poly(3-hydroxyalkanoate) synthetase
MYGLNSSQFASAAFLWPALIAESASEFASAAARQLADLAIERQPRAGAREPQWTTQNRVALELLTVRLRDFSTAAEGVPVLICAPFALHAATITDFAPRHSLVAALQGAGIGPVFVTDWCSARPDMRFLSIDNCLADLNILVDELGGRVHLIGLCQGGWMALIYASRFPRKITKLVLAGAPVDIAAGDSELSQLARKTPITIFRELVDIGGGRILGQHALQFWAPSFLSDKRFVICCSRRTRPAPKLCCPLFLLAAQNDDVVAPEQIFATEHLVGSQPRALEKAVAPGGHLSLFMGRKILAHIWPDIARWLSH